MFRSHRSRRSTTALIHIIRRRYNFASTEYQSCFSPLPSTNVEKIRSCALKYLDEKEEVIRREWNQRPVVTLLNGKEYRGANDAVHDTVDAFGNINGKIVYLDDVQEVVRHIKEYQVTKKDYRHEVRSMEDELFDIDSDENYVGMLIGNQALDFWKQDGVTEIEEAIMANAIERRMNDLLMRDEEEGKINIERVPAFVGCVSNFGNFLDLCRKVLRNMECGVPVVILSRSNTTQNSFRWSEVLAKKLMPKYGIDPGMLTFASCSVDDVKEIMNAVQNAPMYITCSRDLAETIKKFHPNTIASTGGPNTLVSSELNDKIEEAIKLSTLIENSGQCTALRHAVVPCTEDEVTHIFDSISTISSPVEALRKYEFAALIESDIFQPIENPVLPMEYLKQPGHDIHYRVSGELPPDGIPECWRQPVVDFTNKLEVDALCGWLVRNQPISLAINTEWDIAREIFEKTALVVYTVGSQNRPALTCQARPQEKEIFGEFPVRRDLTFYTKYPVVIPSSTPAYNSHYTVEYLKSVSLAGLRHQIDYIKPLLNALETKEIQGFCIEIANYIVDSVGPKPAFGSRTVLWGLQRPPLNGMKSVIRCGKTTCLDDLLPSTIPFIISNAREQLEISIDPHNGTGLTAKLHAHGKNLFKVILEDVEEFEKRTCREDASNLFYNVMVVEESNDYSTFPDKKFPLPSSFVSLFLPMGHIKSTKANDDEFIETFQNSEKWLTLHWHGTTPC